MRPGLLEDKPLLTPVTDVDTAAVGEMERLTNLVGHVVDGRAVPGCEVGRQNGRERHPLRHAKHHVPTVRDQLAAGAFDGQLQLAGGAHAPALGKTPVSHIQGPRRPAEIAQDVWAGLTVEQVSQLDEHGLELRFVGRVDGDELAAGPTVGVLRVRQEKMLGASDELEGDAARDAVVTNGGEHGLGVVHAGGDVHLPPLRRQGRPVGGVGDPVVELGSLPTRRDWLLGKREIWIALQRRQVGIVVEGAVGQAIQLIGQFHGPPTLVTKASFRPVRAAAPAAAATGLADYDNRLPTYSVMADHPPAMPARSPHAMPHKAMLCLPQTLGRGELRSRCCLWVCYTAHTCLPLYAPSAEVALLAIIEISMFD